MTQSHYSSLRTGLFMCLALLFFYRCGDERSIVNEKTHLSLTNQRVVFISLDGFPYDWLTKPEAVPLKAIAHSGTYGPLVPPFPSLTFPSHTSMITGLRPHHHGIVGNWFCSPKHQYQNIEYVEVVQRDGYRYWDKGIPITVLAESQGCITAACCFPGTDVEVQNTLPTYHLPYKQYRDMRLQPMKQINQIIEWLQLPTEKAPKLILGYLSSIDRNAHHRGGCESPNVKKAMRDISQAIQKLHAFMERSSLNINLIIASDHGLIDTTDTRQEQQQFDKALNQTMKAIGSGFSMSRDFTQLMFYAHHPHNSTSMNHAYQCLKDFVSQFPNKISLFRKAALPPHLHYQSNDNIGDFVILAQPPHTVFQDSGMIGIHGYDPKICPAMNGIFIGSGPQFKSKQSLPPTENINLYPTIAQLLGLKVNQAIDGHVMSTALR